MSAYGLVAASFGEGSKLALIGFDPIGDLFDHLFADALKTMMRPVFAFLIDITGISTGHADRLNLGRGGQFLRQVLGFRPKGHVAADLIVMKHQGRNLDPFEGRIVDAVLAPFTGLDHGRCQHDAVRPRRRRQSGRGVSGGNRAPAGANEPNRHGCQFPQSLDHGGDIRCMIFRDAVSEHAIGAFLVGRRVEHGDQKPMGGELFAHFDQEIAAVFDGAILSHPDLPLNRPPLAANPWGPEAPGECPATALSPAP